jgi:hypothetical protein
MAFSYSINAGSISSAYDSTYLKNTFGFSTTALTLSGGSTNYLSNVDTFARQYQNIFGKTLAVSDAYSFFDDQTGTMDHLLSTGNISYTSNTTQDRIDVYKEAFMEQYNSGETSDIATSANAFNLASYTGGSSVLSSGKINTATVSMDNLETLYNKLSSEATSLKSELNSNILAYGGYPEIKYNQVDAQTALLQKELDNEMQNFLKLYDDLFAFYKIKSGGTQWDNGVEADDRARREKEAATAATLAATLSLKYAQTTYSQDIAPSVSDYVFENAGTMFGSIVNSNNGYVSLGAPIDGSGQQAMFKGLLSNYVGTGENVTNMLSNNQSDYVLFNQIFATNNKSAVNAASTDDAKADAYLWNMATTPGVINVEGDSEKITGLDNVALDEIGDTVPAYIAWMVRDSFGVGGDTATVRDTTYTSDKANYLATSIMASAKKLIDLKMQVQTNAIETSINNNIRAEYEARVGAMQAIQDIMYAKCPDGTDPYEITINGQKYIMGQDSNSDGNITNIAEILGIQDTKDNTFSSMKALDANNDGYVSQEELNAQNIILSAVDDNGKLTGASFDMNQVKGISLASLQAQDGTNNIFGKFTMDFANNKTASGNATFEDRDYFSKLFGLEDSSEDIDVESSVTPILTTSTNTASVSTAASTASTATTATTASTETTASTASTDSTNSTAKAFSFDFSDATDSETTFEKLLDQISWQMGISNLSFTQKAGILDDVDSYSDQTLAESKIREDLESINFSA